MLDHSQEVRVFMAAADPLDFERQDMLRSLASCRETKDFCLRMACLYSHADAAEILIEELGADAQLTNSVRSARRDGLRPVNLLELALSAHRQRPAKYRQGDDVRRLARLLTVLMKNSVTLPPDADPMEGAVHEAYLLSLMAATRGGTKTPYELFRHFQPAAVTAYEDARRNSLSLVWINTHNPAVPPVAARRPRETPLAVTVDMAEWRRNLTLEATGTGPA